MFLFHVAFSLGLIALSAGTVLFVWSQQHTDVGIAKIIGLLVIILASTSTLCTVYYGVRYWQQGYFQSPMSIEHNMAMPKQN